MGRPICFFDMDGTLLSHRSNCVPASTVLSFERLQAQGIPCILCSGRGLFEIEELRQTHALHFDGYILLTGAYAADERRNCLFDRAIDPETLTRTVSYLEAQGLAAMFTNAHGGWMNRYTDKVMEIQRQIHTAPRAIGNMQRIYEEPVYQISVYADQNEAKKFLNEIHALRPTWWHPQAFDLSAKGVSKGWAMQKMCAHAGYSWTDAVAFGDGNNDVDMLERAGLGIAMGNGSPDCKAKADYVTADIDDDGIYKALVHFGLIA